MKKSTTLIIVGFVTGLVLIGAALGVSRSKNHDMTMNMRPSAAAAVTTPNTITISDFAFGPAKLTVKKGTTVTWINMDDAHHNITPTSGSPDFMASNLLAKGQKYTFTFTKVGTYSYKCSPHPYMKGTIEVTE